MFFLSLSVFLLLGSVPSVIKDNDSTTLSTSNYDLAFSAVSWNKSDYFNFTGPAIDAGGGLVWFRIFIDDTDPSRNWSGTASNNSWLTGSGTYLDPYIIENLYINGGGSAGMIFVKNSDKFFIIRNCWFDYSGSNEYDVGVLLQWASNGTIENNIFTYTHIGVTIEFSSLNNTVVDNTMISDHTTAGLGRGIQVDVNSHNNTFLRNKIRNYYHGIYINRGNENIVDGNYAENNIWGDDYTGSPIMLLEVNNSKVIRNVLARSFSSDSFQIEEGSGTGNTIINNTVVTGEAWSFGPETSGMIDLNTPKLQQNGSSGISIDGSHNSLVAHNLMLREGEGGGGAIPGFDIFIVIGMFGLISVLSILVKQKKH